MNEVNANSAVASAEKYAEMGFQYLLEHGPKLLLAVLVLIIGLRLIKIVGKLVSKAFEKQNVDETLRPFLRSLIIWLLKAVLFISVASMLGIETTSLVAIIGAAGLAVGLALQGSLANFAGGVLILLFKPFKVGDLIEAQGFLGVVQEINIFVTKILTLQNELVIIPNAGLSNGNIKNITAKDYIRVDLVIGISYDSDIRQAREVIMNVMNQDENVLKTPAPSVNVLELADSSVNLAVRPYCNPAHYWDVYFGILEKSKIALDQAKITIPFPQRDVHVFNH